MGFMMQRLGHSILKRFMHQSCPHASSHLPRPGDRVTVAMSGGVDSSVTARLLTDQDFDLSAVFMRNWDTRDESGTDKGCEWEKDWEDVQKVCRILDIPCEMVSAFVMFRRCLIDLSRDYWNRVFEPSLQVWERGETPNPDVWCNREIKFGSLMDSLFSAKMQWLATGHYAGIEWDHRGERLRPKLVRASFRPKDQTYYLSAVKEFRLRKTLFPLHNRSKGSVRAMARTYGLPTASREESMGICFVGEKVRFDRFLSNYISPKPGPIIDLTTAQQVGIHDGLWRYTIGQGARLPGMQEKMFVAKKCLRTNEIFVVPGNDHAALYCRGLVMHQFEWIWEDAAPEAIDGTGLYAEVQFRHRMSAVPCILTRSDSCVNIAFSHPQKAVAPGQIAAIYDGDWCLGSGVIADTWP